jgi:CheY-like chemotaxis protein
MDVLVVDDNEVVADSLAFLLDCYGHRATLAHDGEAALRLLRGGALNWFFSTRTCPVSKAVPWHGRSWTGRCFPGRSLSL